MADPSPVRLTGPVLVVGAGLLGTSVALALTGAGVRVLLHDRADEHVRTATGLGAGHAWRPGERVQVVVVAVPPDAVGSAVTHWLAETDAVVTDVGSVKGGPLREVLDVVAPEVARRYVGGHPMAGSERSGPLAATASLFEGRPWAVAPHAHADADAVALVEQLAELCGATVLRFEPDEHDRAVARTSHLPHLLSALVAARLADAPRPHLALSGQGVRDVTRVAAGDPALWNQIVAANAPAVSALLLEVREDLDRLIAAVGSDQRDGVVEVLDRGVRGARSLPGKHGGPARPTASVWVAVPDRPGELARLFGDVGEIGTNVEDLRIEHDQGRPVGLVELVVEESAADDLVEALGARGWTVHR